MNFQECINTFRKLTEGRGDPRFRDYSQSSHLSPKVVPGIRKEKARTHLAGKKLATMRQELPKQNDQELPSPLPGYVKSPDVAQKYRGQLHTLAVKRLKASREK